MKATTLRMTVPHFLKIGLFAFILSALNLSLPAPARATELPTVPYVDLDKYLGTWYEIARNPNSFQKNCVAVKAEYSKSSNDRIKVVNSCRKGTLDGKLSTAKGKAKVVDKITNSKLKVSFFWPFYGDYWIIRLDTQYRWVVVSEPEMENLWILSRETSLDSQILEDIKTDLVGLGFDISKLQMTLQPSVPY